MGILNIFTSTDFTTGVFTAVVAFFVIVLAITVHEFVHAWSANYLGDPTARYAGRLTLNPIAHLDLVGSIMLVLVGFGWGKPVPINPNNFQNPRLGSALTSIAGPISNLAFALVLGFIYKLPISYGSFWSTIILYAILINLILMIFNLIPIPPLDGSKFFALFFPQLENPSLAAYGIFLLLAFVFLGGGTILFQSATFLRTLIIGV